MSGKPVAKVKNVETEAVHWVVLVEKNLVLNSRDPYEPTTYVYYFEHIQCLTKAELDTVVLKLILEGKKESMQVLEVKPRKIKVHVES